MNPLYCPNCGAELKQDIYPYDHPVITHGCPDCGRHYGALRELAQDELADHLRYANHPPEYWQS
jgi:hypothetical protein